MNVKILEATDEADKLACKAARNDYTGGPISPKNIEDLMSSIDETELPDEVRDRIETPYPVELEQKMWTLISHLMDHGHFGPFEHPSVTVAIEGVSRSLLAQLTRHRHASFDVESQRYVAYDEFDVGEQDIGDMVVIPPSTTDPDWVGRNASKGSVDEETIERRKEEFKGAIHDSLERYQNLLDTGMPPEDARFVLPIGSKTNIVMTVNLRMLLHIADMRAAADSQWEIRDMTEDLLEAAEDVAPLTMAYYNENLKNRKNRLAP